VLSHFVERWVAPRLERSPWLLPAQTATWAVLGILMFVFYRMSASDFIYFTF
jgi:hypothetical protein